MGGAPTGRKQVGDFLTRQQFRLFGGHLGHGDVEHSAFMPEHFLVQETRRAGRLVHAAVGEVALLDQVQQVGIDLLRGVLGGVATVVFGQAVNGIGVALLGAEAKASHRHGIEHALTQRGHENSP